MTNPTHYTSWSQVPAGTYLTKTQLAQLDLPRRPGPLAATVDGFNYRGKNTTHELYRIDQSTPTTATPAQLAASRARATTDPHLCTDCGAHPDAQTTASDDSQRLCRTCHHIHRLRTLQQDMAARRASAARQAAQLLAAPLAVLHIDLVERGTTPSGTRRAPAAARAEAVDEHGTLLFRTVVRLVGPRAKGVPEDAEDPADAGPRIREALANRHILYWVGAGLSDLQAALRAAGTHDALPSGYNIRHDLRELVVAWRGDLDPTTGHPQPPVPPGRAGRMHYLLQQIAAPETR